MKYELPQWRLYVVHFSDGRLKVGISGDARRRMSYYEQEARRNRVDCLTWWACAPYASKAQALHAERALCAVFRDIAIDRHREWFEGDAAQFGAVIEAAEQARALIGGETGLEARDLRFRGIRGHCNTEAVAA